MSNPDLPVCSHVREHRSLLAAPEKRALVWMARRLPDRINSDHLSALGLASMVAAGLSFAMFRFTPWAALGVVVSLAANWFGDSLDGTVARVRGQQRPRYGFYVDHVIDLAGTTFLIAGLGCSGLMHPLIAAVLLAVYLLVSAETYLATHAAGTFRMSCAGFGPTELRIVLALGALKAAFDPTVAVVFFDPVRLFDLGGLIAVKGLAFTFVCSALRNTRALYRAEPLPARAGGAPAAMPSPRTTRAGRAGEAGTAGRERLRPRQGEDTEIRAEASAKPRAGGGAPAQLKKRWGPSASGKKDAA